MMVMGGTRCGMMRRRTRRPGSPTSLGQSSPGISGTFDAKVEQVPPCCAARRICDCHRGRCDAPEETHNRRKDVAHPEPDQSELHPGSRYVDCSATWLIFAATTVLGILTTLITHFTKHRPVKKTAFLLGYSIPLLVVGIYRVVSSPPLGARGTP